MGATSYQDVMTGLALVLFAIAIIWTARLTRRIGYQLGLSGLADLTLGWLIGTTGFTSAATVPTTLPVAAMIWAKSAGFFPPSCAGCFPSSGSLSAPCAPCSGLVPMAHRRRRRKTASRKIRQPVGVSAASA